jgi:hypothetical protein
MKLFLDISQTSFTVTRGVMEKVDENGRQKTQRHTNEPLWQVQLMALDASGGEILNVTVAGVPPKLTSGQSVIPVELEAIPWAQGTRSGVAFRAASLNPVTAGAKSASAA